MFIDGQEQLTTPLNNNDHQLLLMSTLEIFLILITLDVL